MRRMRLIVEALVLIALGWLVFFGPNVPELLANSRRGRDTAFLLNLYRDAITLYHRDCLNLPAPDVGLSAIWVNPGIVGWRGPYIRGGDPMYADAWGTRLRYAVVDSGFSVRSAGADRLFDTGDDVAVP